MKAHTLPPGIKGSHSKYGSLITVGLRKCGSNLLISNAASMEATPTMIRTTATKRALARNLTMRENSLLRGTCVSV